MIETMSVLSDIVNERVRHSRVSIEECVGIVRLILRFQPIYGSWLMLMDKAKSVSEFMQDRPCWKCSSLAANHLDDFTRRMANEVADQISKASPAFHLFGSIHRLNSHNRYLWSFLLDISTILLIYCSMIVTTKLG